MKFLFWVKFHGWGPSWHRVVAVHDSVVTACHGRFAATEDYLPDADPPRDERCAACERSRIVEHARVGYGSCQDWDLAQIGDRA